MKFSVNSPCPCKSGLKYKKCCEAFHKGAYPKTALQLMRSRFCAFALGDYKYIIKTTHKENPDFTNDLESWKDSILEFCQSCEFRDLKILDFIEEKEESYVTFYASIFCAKEDCGFTEKSRFLKQNNMWLYHGGEFLSS